MVTITRLLMKRTTDTPQPQLNIHMFSETLKTTSLWIRGRITGSTQALANPTTVLGIPTGGVEGKQACKAPLLNKTKFTLKRNGATLAKHPIKKYIDNPNGRIYKRRTQLPPDACPRKGTHSSGVQSAGTLSVLGGAIERSFTVYSVLVLMQ